VKVLDKYYALRYIIFINQPKPIGENFMTALVNAEGTFHLVLPEETRKVMQRMLNAIYGREVKKISHGLNIYYFNPVKVPMAPRDNLYERHTENAEGVISITDGHVLHYYPVKLGWSCSSDPDFLRNKNIPSWRVILPLEVAKSVACSSAESFLVRCDEKRFYLASEVDESPCSWQSDDYRGIYDWSLLFQDLWPIRLNATCSIVQEVISDLPYQVDSKLLKKSLNLFVGEVFNILWNGKTKTIILAGSTHATAIVPIFEHA
jgi:hypothetical protein